MDRFSFEYPVCWHAVVVRTSFDRNVNLFVAPTPFDVRQGTAAYIYADLYYGAAARGASGSEWWKSFRDARTETISSPLGDVSHVTGIDDESMGGPRAVDTYTIFLAATNGDEDAFLTISAVGASTTAEARHLAETLRLASPTASPSPAPVDPLTIDWVRDGIGVEYPFGWNVADLREWPMDAQAQPWDDFALDPGPVPVVNSGPGGFGFGPSVAMKIEQIGISELDVKGEKEGVRQLGPTTEETSVVSARTITRLAVTRGTRAGFVEYLVVLSAGGGNAATIRVFRVTAAKGVPEAILRHVAFGFIGRAAGSP